MIKPTDEMRDTLWRLLPSEVQEGRRPDDIVPWVTAVLGLVQRDYRTEPRPPWERRGAVCPVHHTQLQWGQCVECGPDGDTA